MPKLDGTGPKGQGAQTGRRRGPCATGKDERFNDSQTSQGRGFGRQMGLGMKNRGRFGRNRGQGR